MRPTFSLIFSLLLLHSLASFGQPNNKKDIRPFQDWYFEAVLDGRPQTQVMALHPKIWVAYAEEECRLIHIWHGGDTLFAPVDSSTGLPKLSTEYAFPYLSELPGPPAWMVRGDGGTQEVDPKFLGIREEKGRVWLAYQLQTPAGTAEVWESPEYFSKIRNQETLPGLSRTFWVKENPKDLSIGTKIKAEGLMKSGDLKAKGKWWELNKSKRLYEWGNLIDYDGILELKSGKMTPVEILFTPQPEEQYRRRLVNQNKKP